MSLEINFYQSGNIASVADGRVGLSFNRHGAVFHESDFDENGNGFDWHYDDNGNLLLSTPYENKNKHGYEKFVSSSGEITRRLYIKGRAVRGMYNIHVENVRDVS